MAEPSVKVTPTTEADKAAAAQQADPNYIDPKEHLSDDELVSKINVWFERANAYRKLLDKRGKSIVFNIDTNGNLKPTNL